MSDEPVVTPGEPAGEPIVEPTEPVEPIEPVEPTEPIEPVGSVVPTEPVEPLKPGTIEYTKEVQRRIDQITREKHEAKRRADALERKLAEVEKTVPVTARPDRPSPELFKNEYGELDSQKYNDALIKYEDDLFVWREKQLIADRHKEATQQKREETINEFFSKVEPMREKYADFDEVLNKPVFTPDVQDAIFDSEHGAEIAYFLGKNEREAVRLGRLPLAQMLKEFGKLEVKFSATTKKTVSNAPEPIKPVGGNDVVVKDPMKMSAKEYYEAKQAGLIK